MVQKGLKIKENAAENGKNLQIYKESKNKTPLVSNDLGKQEYVRC
jgi:hypothetical protein